MPAEWLYEKSVRTMPKLNVQAMMKAIAELEAYIPVIEKSNGVKYLYDRIYTQMSNNGPLLLRDIDFLAFTLEDIEEFEDYYDRIISIHRDGASFFIKKLKELPAVPSKTEFI